MEYGSLLTAFKTSWMKCAIGCKNTPVIWWLVGWKSKNKIPWEEIVGIKAS